MLKINVCCWKVRQCGKKNTCHFITVATKYLRIKADFFQRHDFPRSLVSGLVNNTISAFSDLLYFLEILHRRLSRLVPKTYRNTHLLHFFTSLQRRGTKSWLCCCLSAAKISRALAWRSPSSFIWLDNI